MVKARVMGSEMYPEYQELRQMLRPFVFRRYIDFSAVQSLRRMKSMISSEVRRRGLSNNIKLGAGGMSRSGIYCSGLSIDSWWGESRAYEIAVYWKPYPQSEN